MAPWTTWGDGGPPRVGGHIACAHRFVTLIGAPRVDRLAQGAAAAPVDQERLGFRGPRRRRGLRRAQCGVVFDWGLWDLLVWGLVDLLVQRLDGCGFGPGPPDQTPSPHRLRCPSGPGRRGRRGLSWGSVPDWGRLCPGRGQAGPDHGPLRRGQRRLHHVVQAGPGHRGLGFVASGFVLRALAGGVAVGVPISTWFLAVTSFGALFVAAGKRFAELKVLGEDSEAHRQALGDYTTSFLQSALTLTTTVTVAAYFIACGPLGARAWPAPSATTPSGSSSPSSRSPSGSSTCCGSWTRARAGPPRTWCFATGSSRSWAWPGWACSSPASTGEVAKTGEGCGWHLGWTRPTCRLRGNRRF